MIDVKCYRKNLGESRGFFMLERFWRQAPRALDGKCHTAPHREDALDAMHQGSELYLHPCAVRLTPIDPGIQKIFQISKFFSSFFLPYNLVVSNVILTLVV